MEPLTRIRMASLTNGQKRDGFTKGSVIDRTKKGSQTERWSKQTEKGTELSTEVV